MTWRIKLAHDGEEPGLAILGVLIAQLAWKRLSKAARKAVADAYPDGRVKGHPATLGALKSHGFIEWEDADPATSTGYRLTVAGRECARWNILCRDPYPAMAGEPERSCTRTLGHVDPVHRNGGDTWTHEPAESTTNGGHQ